MIEIENQNTTVESEYQDLMSMIEWKYQDLMSMIEWKEEERKRVVEEDDGKKKDISLDFTINSITNVVPVEKLRKIQSETLNQLKDFLSRTFGPMGSYTKIITGNTKDSITSSYSKDGLKVLRNISSQGPIEMSIIEELIEITRHVEKEVGDGTTSTVILSSIIFDSMIKIQKEYNIPPYQLISYFKDVVDEIKEEILSHKRECTLEDIYNISMISTNGNKEVADNICKIYEKFGMNVDLSVGISNTTDSLLKEYNGLTITEGMSDPVYITNRELGTSEIPNAHIYHFKDPIDDMYMIGLFEAILQHNIYDPYDDDGRPIPTVIVCPRISRDMSTTLKMLANQLYRFDQNGTQSDKPPILIITNVVASDEILMDDIANLCGCKSIGKYIDPKMLKRDQENGTAPTVDNVWEFAGHAERVVSDSHKTKFINPKHMHIYKEDGSIEDDPIYTAMVNFLETEIANAKATDSATELGILRRRLSSLKANTVDYLVGGVTISDRDALKDLVEDAVKNCKSATLYGVGYAANFEGLRASYNIFTKYDDLCAETDDSAEEEEIKHEIAYEIFFSYIDISRILYSTVCSNSDWVNQYITKSIVCNKCPYNISRGYIEDYCNEVELQFGQQVECSIMLDVQILDTISKIITLMVTSNQCLLQAPSLNTY